MPTFTVTLRVDAEDDDTTAAEIRDVLHDRFRDALFRIEITAVDEETAVDRCEDCGARDCPDCGMHYCCEPCGCNRSHYCRCECRGYDQQLTNAE
jgi:hypothetical protein